MSSTEQVLLYSSCALAVISAAVAWTALCKSYKVKSRVARQNYDVDLVKWQLTGVWRLSARQRIREVFGPNVAESVQFQARAGEDAILICLLLSSKGWHSGVGGRGGYIVEAGAFDGHRGSVSWVFEQLGWTGLLVEAQDTANRCALLRPMMRVVRAALVAPNSPSSLEFVTFEGDEPSRTRARLKSERSDTSSGMHKGAKPKVIQVPTATLDELLRDVPVIDVLSLDLEGGELAALHGARDAITRTRVALIEDPFDRMSEQVHLLLSESGLRRVARFGLNVLYVREADVDLLRSAFQLMFMQRRGFLEPSGPARCLTRSQLASIATYPPE
jgi:FkbM family methyltransferase